MQETASIGKSQHKWGLRVLTGALYAQGLVALLVGFGYLTAAPGFAAGEPISGRKAGVFFWAFAITLFLVARMFRSDNRWLLIPLVVTALNLGDTLYELLARGDHAFDAAVVIEPTFLSIWVIGYLTRSRGARGRSLSGQRPPGIEQGRA